MDPSEQRIAEDAGSNDMDYQIRGFEPDDATMHSVTEMPADVVALRGYLGKSKTEQFRRLFKDVTFRRWIAVDDNDIVCRYSLEGKDRLTAGQSVIWVRRTANLVVCESVRATVYESSTKVGSDENDGAYKWPRP